MKTNKYVSKRRQSIQLLNVNIHVGEKKLNIYSSYFNMLTPKKLNRSYNVESDRNKRDVLKRKSSRWHQRGRRSLSADWLRADDPGGLFIQL